MAIVNEIHPIQTNILLVLLFRPNARYTELNVLKVPTDQFTFHLRTLLGAELIEKKKDLYLLTTKGKEFANRLDTDRKVIERQAKLAVVVVGVKKIKATTYYLMQERLKQPYYGFWGFISGKIRWGEKVVETAERELKEETGLKGKINFVGIEHKMDYSKENQLLEDKFFYFCTATKSQGALVEHFEGGKNKWLSKKQIKSLSNCFPDVLDIIDLVEKRDKNFWEQKYIVEKY